MQRRQLLGLTLGACVAPAWSQQGHDVTPWPAQQPAPPLQALDLQGRTWTLERVRGRAVVLNFWATWCPPCRAEMPSLQQLAEIYGPERLQVLALNVGEGPRRIAQYLQSSGLELTVLLDPKSEHARAWGARVLPTTILIDAGGRPRRRVRGELDWSGREAQALIKPLLPRASRPAGA
ncbi:MAG: TlpA disulfide reductase family protein [Curvibacter sp.]